jgi:muramoyltetrapeptide carboxypeptidase
VVSTWPAPVSPQASLGVWAPSSPASVVFPRRFERGLRALQFNGYRTVLGRTCAAATGASTLSAHETADDLHELLISADAVIAAVGGWTLNTVLPYIDWQHVADAGKAIIGYSDLTSLVNLVPMRCGLVSFHGPMVLSEWGEAEGAWPYTVDNFQRVVGAGDWTDLTITPAVSWSDELLWWDQADDRQRRPQTAGETARTLVPGDADGVLWGGSLVVLGLLAGTPFWPQPHSRSIVILEAEAMAPDELCGRLAQLGQAGAFRDACGVAFGKIGRPPATASGYRDFDEVIRSALPPGIPVAAGLDIGHTEPMCTLPIGAEARLHCGEGRSPDLTLRRPAITALE